MSESSIVWRTLKNKMSRDVWLQRIENSVGRGTPDVWFVTQKGPAGWIELKYAVKRGRTPRTTFRLSPAQLVFAKKCYYYDVPYCLLGAVQVNDTHQWFLWCADQIAEWPTWTWLEAESENWFCGERFEPLTLLSMVEET